MTCWRTGSFPIYIQQAAKLHSLFYLETALHVSGGTITHQQERKQLYLQHLVFVTPLLLSAAIVKELELSSNSSTIAALQSHPNLHTKRSSVQVNIYQISYWYNSFSWWLTHGCQKHVENWNEHTWKRIVLQVGYLQGVPAQFHTGCLIYLTSG